LRRYEDGSCDVQGFFKTRSPTHEKLRYAYESGTILRLIKPVADFLRVSLGWTSTIMVKKMLLLSVGGFEATLGNYEDHHLWIRIAREADFYFVPEVVTWYRDHPLSVSRKEGPPAYWYIVALRLLLQDPNFRPHRALIRRRLASLFEQNMYYHRTRGERSLAIMDAARAILHQPTRMVGWRDLVASIAGGK
jgi:hypothetical protein